MQFLFNRIKKLEPIETGFQVDDTAIAGIKAVLFDIYGTLIISASGDIGSSSWKGQSAIEVLREFKISVSDKLSTEALGLHVVHCFEDSIINSHQISREQGLPHPEVDIIDIWKTVLEAMKKDELISNIPEDLPWHKFALSFELYNNAVYPMPSMIETLQSIHKKGLPLGIVSNAQYFTPMILKHFFEVNTFCDPLPLFHERLQIYSFECGRAKPDVYLYELMARHLIELGLTPQECLYVGNDMLNDISPASEVGFKTVLYAGDERSLRLRENHPRCIDCKPDRSITSLPQLLNIIG